MTKELRDLSSLIIVEQLGAPTYWVLWPVIPSVNPLITDFEFGF